jgi:cytochrome c-type biogenesis protein CcmH/NrfF
VRVALAVVAASLLLAVPASACPRTSLGDVEDEVMCLECGVPLDVAEGSLQANQERTFITKQIAACRTKDQIKDALAAQYGDRVLATPKAKGFGLAAYVVPTLAVLAAAAAIGFAALRWRRSRVRPAAPQEPDPRESARLDADLARHEPL